MWRKGKSNWYAVRSWLRNKRVSLSRQRKNRCMKMTEKLGKLYWHIHHDTLFERTTEPISNRIAYIKKNKPSFEVPTRLRLLKPIKNVRALKRIDEAIAPAWKAYYEAIASARKAYDEAIAPARKALEALHKQECPNCPWDGHTIFPNCTSTT